MEKYSRTKHYIALEFKRMVETQPLKSITVNEIACRCKMNRGTFYYHFRDKQDLINWIYHTEVTVPVRRKMTHSSMSAKANYLFFQKLYESKKFYCQAIRLTGQNDLESYIYEEAVGNFKQAADNYVKYECGGEVLDKFGAEYLTLFYARANAALVVDWIRNGMPDSPEHIAAISQKANHCGMMGALKFCQTNVIRYGQD